MSRYTAALDEPLDAATAGGKGANLAALIGAGFPVPQGFVVTTRAYRDFIEAAGLVGATPERLREVIPRAEVPARIADPVLAGYADLGSPPVAVRSSGTAEDLAEASFAGQHDTYLGVIGSDAVIVAMRKCWASLWTPRAVDYRRGRLLDERGLAMAVVIQTMVDAQWSGVMFTADPVSGRRDRIMLEAVSGLGEALVSGQVTGQHCEIDKPTRSVVSGRSTVPATALLEIIVLGLDVERHFGSAQDIEWTWAAGRCALTQARPLTGLPDEPTDSGAPLGAAPTTPAAQGSPGLPTPTVSPESPPSSPGSPRSLGSPMPTGSPSGSAMGTKPLGPFAITADHMPYPPFPLDMSLIVRPAARAILDAIHGAGFSTPPPQQVLVEIDDGVVQIAPPRIRPTWRSLVGIPAAVPAVLRLVGTSTGGWRARVDRSLMPLLARWDAADLSGLSDQQLIDAALTVVGTTGALMPARFGGLVRGMVAEQMLRPLLRGIAGRHRGDALHAGLMSAVPCVTTAANDDLQRMAEIVRGTPELRDTYESEEPVRIADRLRNSEPGRRLLAEVDGHLARYGYRAMSIFTVGLPPLRDTPWIVHGVISSLAQSAGAEGRSGTERFEGARAELAGLRGARSRLLCPAISRLLGTARDGTAFREDSHYYLEMALAIARRVLLELGRRLVHRGILADRDDIAYLELDEIAAAPSSDTRQIVARRRAARAAALDHYTVIRLAGAGAACADGNDGTDGRDKIRGTPASRGQFAGPVRVIHDETEFPTLRNGEVLVCPYTNPMWTPLFSVAGAVVVDSGGAASHAAIVARECGIPAVMGTGIATRTLRPGERVVVDGDRGVVTRTRGSAGAHASL